MGAPGEVLCPRQKATEGGLCLCIKCTSLATLYPSAQNSWLAKATCLIPLPEPSPQIL